MTPTKAPGPPATIRWSTAAQLGMAAIFVFSITAPFLAHCLSFKPDFGVDEFRRLSNFPAFERKEWDKFPAKFEKAFNDRFALRGAMLWLNSWFKVRVVGVSSTEDVVIGKEGWYFLKDTVTDYRGLTKFGSKKIDLWELEFSAKAEFFAQRNVHYLLVIAPNKETIYPEYLPSRIHRVHSRTRIDRILEAIGPDPAFDLLDLRAPVLAAKKQTGERLFQLTDSHWNDLGGRVASTEIIQRLRRVFPDLPEVPAEAYESRTTRRTQTDLARMLGLGELISEQNIELVPKSALVARASIPWRAELEATNAIEPVGFESVVPGRSRRVILWGDSFCIHPAPFLAAHFQRLVRIRPPTPYVRTYQEFVPKLVTAERPDVFIELLVERHFHAAPKHVFGR